MRRIFLAIITLAMPIVACAHFPPPRASTPESPRTTTPVSTTQPGATITEPLAPIPLHVGRGARDTWFELYFTDPANPASAQMTGGIETPLVSAMDGARLSVHAAMYSLTLNDVRAALLRAYRRGIDVKVVMESDNLDAPDPQMLKEAGIPLLGDRRQGLMHNKFIVIDGTEVWTGSMNFTNSGAYLDNNVLMRLRSREVAEDYEAEFAEMFVDDHFGPDTGNATPHPSVNIDGTVVEVYFSPDDHVEAALSRLLASAKSSAQFLAYSFTADELGQALLRVKAAGLNVSGVMDAEQATSNLGTELRRFQSAGLDVRLDGNPGQMHEKVLIVDNKVVVLGSYNFTASADDSNDENLVIIHNAEIAEQVAREFRRIYALAHP